MLPSKDAIVGILSTTRNQIHAKFRSDGKAVRIVRDIDDIIAETKCCINTWQDVANLYKWSRCQLMRSLEYIDDTAHYANAVFQIEKLEKAHAQVGSLVLAYLSGKDNSDGIAEIGFN